MKLKELSKEIREWGVFILAVGTLSVGIFSLLIYIDTTQSVSPDLKLTISDQINLDVSDLNYVWHMSNGSFGYSKNYLTFRIANLGLKKVDYLNIYIEDEGGEYHFKNTHVKNLESLEDRYPQIPFFSVGCYRTVLDSLDKNGSYKKANDKCDDIENNLTLGIHEFIVNVDCPSCEFKGDDEKCFSFKLCIYDDNETSICGEDPHYYNLIETSCPKDLF